MPPAGFFLYRGVGLEETTPVIGYGTLSAGVLKIDPEIAKKKSFGVGGQGNRGEENKGFTMNPDNTEDKCITKKMVKLTENEIEAKKDALKKKTLTDAEM